MKCAVLVVAIVAFAMCASAVTDAAARAQFAEWSQKHGKLYGDAIEQNRRLAIFKNSLEFIEMHNAKFARGEVTYETGLNEYADLTDVEFSTRFNGYVMDEDRLLDGQQFVPSTKAAPKSVDWRKKGAVTPVKNQGQCGSCWAFSATGAIEGAHFLTNGALVSLSEQNLVDCSVKQGNHGCNGGLMDYAFEYIITNGGIDTEDSYPYTATGPNSCKFQAKNIGATLKSYKKIPARSESALTDALANVGPVSVAIDASPSGFRLYKSGVFYDASCSSYQLNHGVLAVGYGTNTTTSQDYYIVKNSWGTTWGANGYILMSRNRSNNCGIATDASYPIAGNSTTTAATVTSGTGGSSGYGSSGRAV